MDPTITSEIEPVHKLKQLPCHCISRRLQLGDSECLGSANLCKRCLFLLKTTHRHQVDSDQQLTTRRLKVERLVSMCGKVSWFGINQTYKGHTPAEAAVESNKLKLQSRFPSGPILDRAASGVPVATHLHRSSALQMRDIRRTTNW